jgi:hypothetical protein
MTRARAVLLACGPFLLAATACAARAVAASPPGRVLTSLSGATGLVDIPAADTPPAGSFAISTQLERVRATDRYWSPPYDAITQAQRYFALTWAPVGGLELGLTLESWDKELRYANPIGDERPSFLGVERIFPGIVAKKRFDLSRWPGLPAQAAIGFRLQRQPEKERSLTEFHEYERFSHAFATLSGQPSRVVLAHAMFRAVALRSRRPIAGRTDGFVGYTVPGSWRQWGLGLEWLAGRHVKVIGEVLEESGIRFRGDLDRTDVNLGVRYEDDRKGLGFWARRVNHDGLADAGLQMAWRF